MLQGSLTARAGVADVLRVIYTERRSGILHVERHGIVKKLFIEKGSFAFSETNEPGWRLGELLVKRGTITQDDLADVLTLTATGKRIGRVLRELGLLSEDQLGEAVRYQVLESVYPVFAWTEGRYRFEELERPTPEDIALALSTANVIMEGVRRIDDPAMVATALGSTSKVVVLGSNPLLRFQSIFLKPKEGFILSRIDGVLTMDEVSAISPVPEEETLRCLYGLHAAGILELRTPEEHAASGGDEQDIAGFFTELGGIQDVIAEASATPVDMGQLSAEELQEREDVLAFHGRIASLKYHEVLGVDPTAPPAAVRKAYYRLAKRYHPDRHHKSHLAELYDKLETVFVRINESYEAMREGKYKPPSAPGQPADKPASTPSQDAASRKDMAEASYRHGRRLLDENDFFGAVQAFRRAVQLNPERADYHGYLGRVLAKNPKWRKDAESHLLKAAEMEPQKAEHYAQLGQLYVSAQLYVKAERFFDEALKWDAQSEAAIAGKAAIAEADPKRKGLGAAFRNLFNEKRK